MTPPNSSLTSLIPSETTRAKPLIGHVQLRDLLVCDSPRILRYVHRNSIVEHNLDKPNYPRRISKFNFRPIALSSLRTEDDNSTLIAAGGQDAEVHLSMHQSGNSRPIWQAGHQLSGTINNSVSLVPHLPSSSAAEPRLAVSNNDHTVKFYDVPTRSTPAESLNNCGTLALDAQVNYCAVSPSGSTVLAVGDSNQVSLSHVRGSSSLTFEHAATFILPVPSFFLPHYCRFPPAAPFRLPGSSTLLPPPSPSDVFLHNTSPNPTALTASFSAAFSSSGMNFAVASQEGLVAVWDVRSTKVLKVFETTPRDPGQDFGRGGSEVGSASGWITEFITSDPFIWTPGLAPGWSVRSVKFGGRSDGKETMSFTEHTDYFHIVDARTFEKAETIRVPSSATSASSRRKRVQAKSHRRSPNAPQVHGGVGGGGSSSQSFADIVRTLERDAVSRAVNVVEEPPTSQSRDVNANVGFEDGETEFMRTVAAVQTSMQALIQQLQDAQASSPANDEGPGGDAVRRVLRDSARMRQANNNNSRSNLVSPSDHFLPPDPADTPSNEQDVDLVGSSTGIRWTVRDGVVFTRSLDDIEEEERTETDRRRDLQEAGSEMQVDDEPSLEDVLACDLDDERERLQIEEEAAFSDAGSFLNDDSEDDQDIVTFAGEASRRNSNLSQDPPLDLAGLCYDPSGAHVYVASDRGIGEWSVKGAGSQWFAGGHSI